MRTAIDAMRENVCMFVYIYVQTHSGTDSEQTLCTAETSQQMPYEATELPLPQWFRTQAQNFLQKELLHHRTRTRDSCFFLGSRTEIQAQLHESLRPVQTQFPVFPHLSHADGLS